MFDRRAHPALYDSLLEHAHASPVEPRGLHHVMSAEEASHLVIKGGGFAFLTKAGALRVAHDGLVARELDEDDLCLDVHMAARADNKSKARQRVRSRLRQEAEIGSGTAAVDVAHSGRDTTPRSLAISTEFFFCGVSVGIYRLSGAK